MLLSSSNRKYPPFPLLSNFSVVVCQRYLLHHIRLLIAYTFRENREFVFIIIVQFMMSANIRIRFGLQIVRHLIIIIVQTYLKALSLQNACQIYFVECVSKIKHTLSVIHYTICRAVCFQFTHSSCGGWENIYTLSYYQHQIGSMKQWCALYVFLYSYEFVIWPDCFVGHSCSRGICPESGPLSLTCNIITMLGILLTIDT